MFPGTCKVGDTIPGIKRFFFLPLRRHRRRRSRGKRVERQRDERVQGAELSLSLSQGRIVRTHTHTHTCLSLCAALRWLFPDRHHLPLSPEPLLRGEQLAKASLSLDPQVSRSSDAVVVSADDSHPSLCHPRQSLILNSLPPPAEESVKGGGAKPRAAGRKRRTS